jgi:hypothetical protein
VILVLSWIALNLQECSVIVRPKENNMSKGFLVILSGVFSFLTFAHGATSSDLHPSLGATNNCVLQGIGQSGLQHIKFTWSQTKSNQWTLVRTISEPISAANPSEVRPFSTRTIEMNSVSANQTSAVTNLDIEIKNKELILADVLVPAVNGKKLLKAQLVAKKTTIIEPAGDPSITIFTDVANLANGANRHPAIWLKVKGEGSYPFWTFAINGHCQK